MFHLRHPRSRHFLTWDELGCLCRSLGFPGNLLRYGLGSDVTEVNKRGLEVKTLLRLVDLRLLDRSLHLTYNLHTADWNTRALVTALELLLHRALDFDGVSLVRLAYATYEHMDMKGMALDTRVLLRALKMCGRAIAPLKLARKVMHSKSGYVEKGRIQLDEFFGLVLWTELYTEFHHDGTGTDPVKIGALFKLADFATLLSHHDERLTKQLNDRYLRDERTFAAEQFGHRGMFRDSTVDVDFRKEQVDLHKDKFRRLKSQINQSQRRVNSAHAGSVRPRPISTPDLNKYRNRQLDRHDPAPTRATLTFQLMRKPGRPDTPRADISNLDSSVNKEVRVMTPRGITPADLLDVKVKMDDLQFDIITLVTRCRVQVENERMFYLPGHVGKVYPEAGTVGALPAQHEPRHQHRTTEIRSPVSCRSAPPSRRAQTCDLRDRERQVPGSGPRPVT